jgi:hypothetical protein
MLADACFRILLPRGTQLQPTYPPPDWLARTFMHAVLSCNCILNNSTCVHPAPRSIDGLIALLFLCVHPEQGQLPSFDWQMRMSSSTGAKPRLFGAICI